nr:DUF397 domain-containing protein [Micromonospora sp. DSM 115978]
MPLSELSQVIWRTSTRSGENGGLCVEVATLASAVAVRDSKDRPGPTLTFTPTAWTTFLTSLDGNRP